MFSPKDSPSHSSPGKGRSFVKLDVTAIPSNAEKSKANLDVLLFNSKLFGELQNKTNQKDFGCEHLEDPVLKKKATRQWNIDLSGDHVRPLKEKVKINRSGVYYLYFLYCNEEGPPSLLIDGETIFMNPYGYLPGEMYYYLPFFGALALVYLLIAIGWGILSIKYRKELLPLQNWIGGVILLGLVEMASWYFDNLGYNNSGENYVGAMIVGVLVSTVKRTISRLLVLVVSMGYGVVKPSLGTTQYKVILLGILYFIFSGSLNIIELVERTQVVSPVVFVFLVFPVTIIDTIFYWWIFLSLLRTITQLTQRKQIIKLQMYKQFFLTLIISGVLSALTILIQIFVGVSKSADETWKSNWIWTAFSHILYLFVLVSIAIIWRPTTNNTRYAYHEVEPSPDNEEISLDSLTHVHVAQRNREEKKEQKTQPKEKFSYAFGIDEEDSHLGPSKLE